MNAIKVTNNYGKFNKKEDVFRCRLSDYIQIENSLSKDARKVFIFMAASKVNVVAVKDINKLLSATNISLSSLNKALSELKEKGYIIEVENYNYELVIPDN